VNFPRLLRSYLETPEKMIIAPGAYDGISARLIAEAGYEVIYMTGAGTAASRIGQPDIGLTTMSEMVSNAAMIVECTDLPVIADADTGYGNALNVVRTVREYERANVAGIHLEDQVSPKRCGHLEGKQIVPTEEFVQKIKAAVDTRRNPEFVIIARTDARAVHGFEEAIRRANLYIEAGADVGFVEAPMSVEEMAEIPKLVKGPCLLNMPGPGSKTPALPSGELKKMGYKIVIYPTLTRFVLLAIRQALRGLKEKGIFWGPEAALPSYGFFHAMGLETWEAFDKKYGAGGGLNK
jgi:2-methylisocitrate lyase-like PEP mutase family enzyme